MAGKTDTSRQPNSRTARPQPGTGVALDSLIELRQEARRLDIANRGKVLATRSGGHLSRFRGRGMEFDESRIYQPGDDPRNMDWRVTARTGQAHVKLFREERERPVWLMVDQGYSMRFGSRVAFKSVVAAQAAALLAWAASDRGDRVGGLVFDEHCHVERRPAARAAGVLPLLQALARASDPSVRGAGYASASEAASQMVRMVHPGSLVVLISDFAGISDADSQWLGPLGYASELTLVNVFDPLEAEAPPSGRYPVSDGHRMGLLNTGDRQQRLGWSERFKRHQAQLEQLAMRHRAHLISLRSDQPVGQALRQGLYGRTGRRGPG